MTHDLQMWCAGLRGDNDIRGVSIEEAHSLAIEHDCQWCASYDLESGMHTAGIYGPDDLCRVVEDACEVTAFLTALKQVVEANK